MHILNFAICGVFGVKSSEGAFLVMKKKNHDLSRYCKAKSFSSAGFEN